jgi:hypothetical protein
MNWLIRKARAEVRHQVATGVQEPLEVVRVHIGDLQARLEAVTDAQHADLQSKILAVPERVGEAVETAVRTSFRAEARELTRMLRQQGDASDEVAETLGRTLARLGAEVEALGQAVERLEARLGSPSPAE